MFLSTHDEDEYGLPVFEVQIRSLENPRMLRNLDSELVGQMIVVPGIITSSSKSQIKASKLSIRCRHCGDTKVIVVKSGLAGANTPSRCEREQQEKCPLNPYFIVPEE